MREGGPESPHQTAAPTDLRWDRGPPGFGVLGSQSHPDRRENVSVIRYLVWWLVDPSVTSNVSDSKVEKIGQFS